jgi:hypothetical protein
MEALPSTVHRSPFTVHRRGGRPISTNPIIDSIASGSAPRVAKLAAARGMLPLGAEDMIEALRLLTTDVDDEVRSAATSTLKSYDMGRLRPVIENPNAPASVVSFLATWKWLPRDLYQPLIFHENMPDEALETMAATSELAEVIELVALKQQSLIRTPTIIDAILANPRRTPEAERRAREIKQEFFEKEYGAQVVAGEQRAQAGVAEPEPEPQVVVFDDLSQFIEPDLVDTVDVLYQEFLDGYGITEKDLPPDDIAERNEFDIASFFAGEEFEDALQDQEGNEERVSVLARIARMSTKDRIKFALKGTREVRMILIRDPNRPVCAAVLQNPRITDQEVETISALKSVNEEVLRLVGTNRAWTRSYSVIHNLVRNPKTPVALSLNFLNRIQSRDLRALGSNKNIPEVVRTMAGRLYLKRQHG